jgi:dimethylaniline monooxygenase (N-oxide forming)
VLKWECDAIAVCSGLHREPNLPVIPGLNHVPQVLHSSEFKTKSQFGVDKTIMVVGSGETGADIAYLAVTSPTKQVLMCHKDGFHFAPKVVLPIASFMILLYQY